MAPAPPSTKRKRPAQPTLFESFERANAKKRQRSLSPTSDSCVDSTDGLSSDQFQDLIEPSASTSTTSDDEIMNNDSIDERWPNDIGKFKCSIEPDPLSDFEKLR